MRAKIPRPQTLTVKCLWKKMIIKTIKNLCLLYICLLALSFCASFIFDFPTFKQVGHVEEGCYWGNAMLPYIDCNGLTFNVLIKTFLNFWLKVVYSVIFSFHSIITFAYFIGLWSPIFYLIWYVMKGRKLVNRRA